jgi:hypothetical protein
MYLLNPTIILGSAINAALGGFETLKETYKADYYNIADIEKFISNITTQLQSVTPSDQDTLICDEHFVDDTLKKKSGETHISHIQKMVSLPDRNDCQKLHSEAVFSSSAECLTKNSNGISAVTFYDIDLSQAILVEPGKIFSLNNDPINNSFDSKSADKFIVNCSNNDVNNNIEYISKKTLDAISQELVKLTAKNKKLCTTTDNIIDECLTSQRQYISDHIKKIPTSHCDVTNTSSSLNPENAINNNSDTTTHLENTSIPNLIAESVIKELTENTNVSFTNTADTSFQTLNINALSDNSNSDNFSSNNFIRNNLIEPQSRENCNHVIDKTINVNINYECDNFNAAGTYSSSKDIFGRYHMDNNLSTRDCKLEPLSICTENEKENNYSNNCYSNCYPENEMLVQAVGDNFVQPVGDNFVQPVDDRFVQPVGDHFVQPVGDHFVQPVGDHFVQPVGDHFVQPADCHNCHCKFFNNLDNDDCDNYLVDNKCLHDVDYDNYDDYDIDYDAYDNSLVDNDLVYNDLADEECSHDTERNDYEKNFVQNECLHDIDGNDYDNDSTQNECLHSLDHHDYDNDSVQNECLHGIDYYNYDNESVKNDCHNAFADNEFSEDEFTENDFSDNDFANNEFADEEFVHNKFAHQAFVHKAFACDDFARKDYENSFVEKTEIKPVLNTTHSDTNISSSMTITDQISEKSENICDIERNITDTFLSFDKDSTTKLTNSISSNPSLIDQLSQDYDAYFKNKYTIDYLNSVIEYENRNDSPIAKVIVDDRGKTNIILNTEQSKMSSKTKQNTNALRFVKSKTDDDIKTADITVNRQQRRRNSRFNNTEIKSLKNNTRSTRFNKKISAKNQRDMEPIVKLAQMFKGWVASVREEDGSFVVTHKYYPASE